jgi:hypothetical protein
LYSALNRRVVKATVLWNMECGEEAVRTPSLCVCVCACVCACVRVCMCTCVYAYILCLCMHAAD